MGSKSIFIAVIFLIALRSTAGAQTADAHSTFHCHQHLIKSLNKFRSLKAQDLSAANKILLPAISSCSVHIWGSESEFPLLKIYLLYANVLMENNRNEEAITLLRNALNDRLFSRENEFYPSLISNIGTAFFNLDDMYNAIQYYEKAVTLFNSNRRSSANDKALNYHNLAYAYDAVGQISLKIDYYKKALEIWSHCCPENIRDITAASENLIESLIDYGDLKAAKQYLDKLLAYQHKIETVLRQRFLLYDEPERERIIGRIELACLKYYGVVFNEKMLLFHLVRMENIFTRGGIADSKNKNLPYLLNAYEVTGYSYKQNKMYDKALTYYRKVSAPNFNGFYNMKAAAFIAIANNEMGNYDSAMFYNDQSLAAFGFTQPGSSYYSLRVLKAELFAKTYQPDSAKAQLRQLYSRLLNRNIHRFHTIRAADLSAFSSSQYVEVLIRTATTFQLLYGQSKQQQDLQHANHFFELAAGVFKNFYDNGFFNNKLWSYLQRINEGLLQTAIDLKLPEQKLLTQISLLEANSSQHLWKKHIDKYSQNKNLPFHLIQKRNSLTANYQRLNQMNEKTKTDSVYWKTAKKELDEVNVQIERTASKLNHFLNDSVDLNALKAQLLPTEAVVNYIVGTGHTYAVVFTRNKTAVVNLGVNERLRLDCEQYFQMLKTSSSNYRPLSARLFKELITPLSIEKNIRSISFIPEDYLNLLPFETLTNPEGKFYLEEKHISYSYSLQIFHHQKVEATAMRNVSIQFVAFAPSYRIMPGTKPPSQKRNRAFYDIPFARREAEIVAGMLDGKIFKNAAATRKAFLENMTAYNVHHLAMHATLNEDITGESELIFFNDERLSFSELYQLNLPSALTVLSACNTGVGVMEAGEGLMSLSRALAYAGVQASVYSLWEIPDKETSEIMVSFYRHLAKNVQKDVALTNAKTAFLQQYPQRSHPYYWAGFVLNGSSAPVVQTRIWPWFAVVGIFMGGAWLLIRRRKKLI